MLVAKWVKTVYRKYCVIDLFHFEAQWLLIQSGLVAELSKYKKVQQDYRLFEVEFFYYINFHLLETLKKIIFLV